jgi:hypothetical protein
VATVSLEEGIRSDSLPSDCGAEVVECVTPLADALPAGQFDRLQRMKEWQESARAKLAAKVQELRSKQREYAPVQEPLYDDVFFEAMALMDKPDDVELPLGRYVKIED